MLRLRRQALGVAAALTTAFIAACGTDHHVTMLSPAFVLPSDPARYADGSPAHAGMLLLRAIEYNEPAAAVSFFVPAWKLTAAKLAAEFRGPAAAFVTAGRNPRILSQLQSGRRATLVVAIHGIRTVLVFEKVGSGWELDRLRVGRLAIAPPGTAHRPTPAR